MARNTKAPVQHYRGTTLQHNNYTGPSGEITVDITKNTAVVQDGATAGGHPLAKETVKIIAGESIIVTGGTLAGDNTIAAKVGSKAQRGVLQVGENLQVSNGTVSSLAWTGELAELTEETGAALGVKLNDTALVHVADENADILGRAVGEIVHSLVPIKCAGLHLLDGSNLASQGLYSAFYQYMLKIHDSGDYPDLFVTETEWQQSVTNYGVCGKFVLDTTGGTIRIPKVIGLVDGTIDATAIGDLTAAYLPTSASGLTSPVLVPSTKGYIYMVVGTYMKLDMAVDVDAAVAVVMDANKRVELKGTRTTTGDWTISDLELWKPLYIITAGNNTSGDSEAMYKIVSGSDDGTSAYAAASFGSAADTDLSEASGTASVVIPTSDTVIVKVTRATSVTLRAYQ